MVDVKHFQKDHASQNIPLTFNEAYNLVAYALEGCKEGKSLAQIQTIALLTSLHNMATYNFVRNGIHTRRYGDEIPKNAAEQIAGVCAAIFELDIAKSEFGFLNPNVPYAMDNSGMGGDIIVTANVSTLASIIAASAGIYMLKHGSPANADRGHHGSSDFISMLGINEYADKKAVEECLETEYFAFTEALDKRYKHIHLQTHKVSKMPHMNDIIGPITNPLNPKLLTRRVVGVNHLIPPRLIAEAYQILNERGVTNLQHGLFVRGFVDTDGYDGMDEVSICRGGTQVSELRNGIITDKVWHAPDFGIEEATAEEISPPANMSKGDFSLAILKGEISGAPLRMVLANTALLFYLAGKSNNLQDCYKQAAYTFATGRPYQTALAVKERLPQAVKV